MARNMLLASALGAVAVLATPPANAVTVVWDFGVGTAGDIGTTATQLSVPNGIPIIATAFGTGGTQPPTPPHLFRKEAGGDEVGLGLTNDPTGDHEINVGNGFIQLDLLNLTIPPLTGLSLSFMADSSTTPDAWQVIGTNTSGVNTGTVLLSGTDEALDTLNATGFRYLDFSATDGNVLLRELNADVAVPDAVPEPASFTVLGAALLGFGLIRRRKNS